MVVCGGHADGMRMAQWWYVQGMRMSPNDGEQAEGRVRMGVAGGAHLCHMRELPY